MRSQSIMLHTFAAFLIRSDRTVLIDTSHQMFRRLYLDTVTLNSFPNPQSSMPNVYYKKKG
ncbi:flavin reductase domain-containing protein FMN-binding protein (plasmid) [Nostoc linckia NIES-25]|nr:flavin reductase domain-containing protein FMN-binding protein [Nostoc linckia NIES-25]